MREFDNALRRAKKQLDLKPGDIYESCSYHPVLCLGVDYKSDSIWGISLIDGTYPHNCSLLHCGIKRLSPKMAWQLKIRGPADPQVCERISAKNRWWNTNLGASTADLRVRSIGPRQVTSKSAKETS